VKILNKSECTNVSGGYMMIREYDNRHITEVSMSRGDQFNYVDGSFSFSLSINGITNISGIEAANIVPNEVIYGKGLDIGNVRIVCSYLSLNEVYFDISIR